MNGDDVKLFGRLLLVASLIGAACANDREAGRPDAGARPVDGGSGNGDAGGGPEDVAPLDRGPPPMEPPLTVRDCPADDVAAGSCCVSALGFEDASTEHFLTPACCRLALSNPQLAVTPTACGRGALRLDADFRGTSVDSLCGQPDEAPACAHRTGEVSRGVSASLDLTGLTSAAMVYLDGPPLPPAPVDGSLFVLGSGGVVAGPATAIVQLHTWTRLGLAIPDDGTAPGADIRVIGIHIDFHDQAWLGHVYVDEITWQ